MMNLEFIKQINEYVIESLMEASNEEILSLIDTSSYPSSEDICAASNLIQSAILENRHKRLEQNKAEFKAHQISQEAYKTELMRRPVTAMIKDIVSALQQNNEVPEGILIAFRDQKNSSDDDIESIWRNLVELGLIDPDENDEIS